MKSHTQKVTVDLPNDLLNRARRATGEGITATLKQGLELVAARIAYQGIRKLRGKVGFSLTPRQMRLDRK